MKIPSFRKRLAKFAMQLTIVIAVSAAQWSCSTGSGTANNANEIVNKDSAQISDTPRVAATGLPVTDSIFEWQVQARNTGYIFSHFRQLRDGGFVATLTSNNAISYDQSIQFLDSKHRKILEGHEENVQLMLKVKKDGQKAWVKMFPNAEDFVQLRSFTVNEEGRVITLVQLGYEYFAKLRKEKEEMESEEEDSDDERENDERENTEVNENEQPEDISTADFGLQFLNEQSQEPYNDAVILIPGLSGDVEITAFETMGADRFVIVGRTFDQDLSQADQIDSGNEAGDFIWVVDSKGNRIWSDVTRFPSREGFYYQEHLLKPTVSIHDDVIYVASQHFGQVTFSNGETLKSTVSGEHDRWTYVISYSRAGAINWVRANETLSNPTSIKAAKNGVYLSQKIFGSSVFGNRVDTSGHVNQFLTLLNLQGKHQWSSGFPVNNICSIQTDTEGLPVVMGNYNDVVYDRPLKDLHYHGLNLNDKHDLFVISLDNTGSISNLFTVNLQLENSLNSNRPQMIVGDNDSVYIICHSKNFFNDTFNYEAYKRAQFAGDISFLGKLRYRK